MKKLLTTNNWWTAIKVGVGAAVVLLVIRIVTDLIYYKTLDVWELLVNFISFAVVMTLGWKYHLNNLARRHLARLTIYDKENQEVKTE